MRMKKLLAIINKWKISNRESALRENLKSIGDILLSLNTYKEAVKFQKYRDILGNCKIYLFDEECSYLGDSFENHQL